MKNLKLHIILILIFISYFSFSQNTTNYNELDCRNFHPEMTHAEWLEVINYEENTEWSSWKDYKGDWKKYTTVYYAFLLDMDSTERAEEFYGLYNHQIKLEFDGATKEYTVNEHCDFHKENGEVVYNKPLMWYQKWPNKPFFRVEKNEIGYLLTVANFSGESNLKREKIKYDWKEFIADLQDNDKKEDNLNLYNHQDKDPWYKGWPNK